MKSLVCLSICLVCCICTRGQELKMGDSTVVGAIKELTSNIYDNRDHTYFGLTKKQLYPHKTFGTSIVAHSKNDTINRIIAISQTKLGQLGTEWYFSKGMLMYVYESFEFFEEQNKKGDWKNFKGLYAWESRYYFVQEEIKYHKHKGRKELKWQKEAKDKVQTGKNILNYVRQQQK